VVTGARGTGKTSALRDLAASLRTNGVTLGGLLAPAVVKDGERTGYDLLDLDSGATTPLCSTQIRPTGIAQGPFRFLPETFQWGSERLTAASRASAQVLFLDELGPLELAGEGWAQAFQQLLELPTAVVVISVRPSLLEQILHRWTLSPRLIWRAAMDDPRDLLDTVSRAVQASAPVQRAGAPLQS
jgi:nucleoside-triphosphatase THEP1